ncbi:zinc finger protein 40 [Apodemus sylvaticus]|uniref:zinc finger protein 40 n=1 Tax=Apodemus sylvaticus TaxID=10129 RepID=UPI0022447B68|nr:zinc finger protein 40 [Apodemus sylvaticus]XP_052012348.1 zinc finger protein 40 [Apodemus sylvaticus]XP_052012349.1 zinc finger protein 40 [Apodemus sylvaticus]
MPRTKQIHPRNLRDKIEEAQKELNGAEVSKKEVLEVGVKGASESLKGVKRKKIVAENHLKKIPKSPLRNPLQTKHKQNLEEPSFSVLPSASGSHKKHNCVPARQERQLTKQNGETLGMTAKASESGDSVSPKKATSPHHRSELRRWRSEGSDPARLSGLDGQRDSNSSSSKTRTDNSECSSLCCSTTPPSYTSTAFDVLLKAMEPELSTLSQKGSSCAIKTEKLRPNKTVRSPSKLKNSSLDAPNAPSPELVAESQSPCTSHPAHVASTQKSEQVAPQGASHLYSPHDHLVPKLSQQNQQLPGHLGLTGSLTNLHTHESTKLEPVYNIAMPPAIGLTSPSTRTQVTPPHQQMDSVSPLSVSPAVSTQSPPGPIYSSTHVASVVSQSVEQMCSLLLRDQKPKKQGKYICEYCNRACAKPSVLLKHIRSHTGERPYPCVTCGFSFKTKSNLYKHKKSHAHTIKLGLVLQPEAGGLFLSQECPKALSVHSDIEDSGESDEEGPGDGRQSDPRVRALQPVQAMKAVSNPEALPKATPSNSDHVVSGFSSQDRPSESQALTELPKVVVHPVSVPPLKTDSPQVASPKPELPSAQSQRDRHVASILSHSGAVSSLETDEACPQKGDGIQSEGKPDPHSGTAHAQLQRQQATDDPQEQQGKLLLSPRSLGSTDSGYFSRSESADQAVSPPTPFARTFATMDPDPAKSSGPPGPRISAPAPALASAEKSSVVTGQMRPPLATKTLEERISKLISDNEALVDDKQLDSVKPRRTSLSRRGSIDSPKSYIFKDSFQFDLKPMGRRTSSSSDIPKSPFTPTEKSKQLFLLSVPSLDCLPITRSNSMPTTGYSAIPANIIPPPPPLRGSQSFDDKIGNFYDDVFVSGPNPSMPPSGHHRPLVRQAAVEDSTASENHLGSGQSLDESCQGCPASGESGPVQSKAAQTPHPEKKKSHQGRGTMFECETCRNRYRKLENFENHKKFYCSELHGPKTKAAVREAEHGPAPGGAQPQVLHYRVAAPTGVWEQTPQIRKRRKMKSVGDDEDLQPRESGRSPESADTLQLQPVPGSAPSPSKHAPATAGEQAQRGIQLVARVPEQALHLKQCPVVEQQLNSAAQDKMEVKRQGGGISVIQHTNSLSRPSSFDKLEPLEGGITFSLQELGRAGMPGALKVIGMSPEEGHAPRDAALSHTLRGEPRESARKTPSERYVLGQPLRLVRQHNIQVPEILVTEEPDRDLEVQRHDEEKLETFTWPQRSETLSKLPTEKLPPKKKRLRLAEVEHSSAESSFESTLSRSLSRESSLSRASSFSASLDVEDISKVELSPKIDLPSKAEFLLIPLGSNTLSVPGSPREMRRAASEQSSCGPTLMDISDFRSKSFDCGSIAPSHAAPARVESQPSNSPSTAGGPGHVPLLERRRGPLTRQISLSIAPDSHLAPGSTPALQTIVLPSGNAMPFQAPRLPDLASADCPAHTVHSQTLAKDLQTEMSSSSSTDIFPPQQLFGAHLLNKTNIPLSHQTTPLPLPVSAQGGTPGTPPTTARVSSTGEGSFAPKYQLQCQAFTSGQACSASPSRPLPNHVPPDQTGAAPHPASVVLSAKAADAMSKACPLPLLEHGLPNEEVQTPLPSFVLPVSQQRSVPVYCFATVTSLPQILVTQDLSNTPVCQTNQNIVPVSEEQSTMPKSQNCLQNALPTPEKDLASKTVLPEMGQSAPVSESSLMVQKMSVGRLSPQQESSASSKRMLSPANSLDIAMEKHQKRAKDENGEVCSTNLRPLELPSSRASESHKQKKPVLVRQLCTTEPLEGAAAEQDTCSASGRSSENANLTQVLPADNLLSRPSTFAVTDHVNELQEFKNTKLSTSLTPPVGNSPAPLESACVLPLKSIDNNQEKGSPGVKHEEDKVIQGQRQPPVPELSLVSSSDTQQPSFPSLKTATSFTWCYLLRQKALPVAQNGQRTSAYTGWTVSSSNPNPLGLPTKVALSLLNSKQKTGKSLYCQAITTHSKSDLVVYSSKWKNNLSKRALGNQKATLVEFSNKDDSEINSEQDKENSLIKSEPRRIKIFDGGYKSNEDYVYVRGRGRGKYICEECGIRCKKPSMLKKHIRTHTDVRPYHCTSCNFSFKTKGNLTKHMKSKAHSKKCVDLGISVGLLDEQDTEESDEKQRFGCERSGYDLEESDGPDEDDNDNEEDDDDSQAESGLSAAPSVTASPQHLPSRSGLQDPGSVEEDLRVSSCFSGVHTDPMDILPRALLTKMTVLSTVQTDPNGTDLPAKARPSTGQEHELAPPVDTPGSPEVTVRSPGHQMSVHYSESDVLRSPAAGNTAASIQDSSSAGLPPAVAQLNPQPAARISPSVSPHPDSQELPKQQITLQPPPGLPSPQTHLFSHLPLHSQQQSRTPYNMVPVGGIHVVPAGLTYSTFVPIQAGPMQLTIPAVSVIHRTMGTSGDTITQVSGAPNRPTGVAELSSVVPCIPIGQIHVPGLQNLSPPALQSLTSLGMETVNIVGLANATVGPPVHPPGLALNAVGLQVLANAPAQSSPAPQTHIPGLQILNIALPTLIPSVGPVAVGTTGTPETEASNSKAVELQMPAGQGHQGHSTAEPPQRSPEGPQETPQTVPGPSADHARPEGSTKTDTKKGASASHVAPGRSSAQAQPTPTPEALQKVATSGPPSLPTDRLASRPPVPHRQPIVHFSDVSSDDDEDRLVIAT